MEGMLLVLCLVPRMHNGLDANYATTLKGEGEYTVP